MRGSLLHLFLSTTTKKVDRARYHFVGDVAQ